MISKTAMVSYFPQAVEHFPGFTTFPSHQQELNPETGVKESLWAKCQETWIYVLALCPVVYLYDFKTSPFILVHLFPMEGMRLSWYLRALQALSGNSTLCYFT